MSDTEVNSSDAKKRTDTCNSATGSFLVINPEKSNTHAHTYSHCKNMYLNGSFSPTLTNFVQSLDLGHTTFRFSYHTVIKNTSENDMEVPKYHIPPSQYFSWIYQESISK